MQKTNSNNNSPKDDDKHYNRCCNTNTLHHKSVIETIVEPPPPSKKIDWVFLFAIFVFGIASYSIWHDWSNQQTELFNIINEVKSNRAEVKINRQVLQEREKEISTIIREKRELLDQMKEVKKEHVAVYNEIEETHKVIKIMTEKLLTGPRHTACDTILILDDLRKQGIDLPHYDVEHRCNKKERTKLNNELEPFLNDESHIKTPNK